MSLQQALYDLFLVDQQVRGLEGRLTGARRLVAAQQEKLDQLAAQAGELRDQLKHTQASEANLESEASGVEQRIGALREQMNTARNNKEYSALLVEVNTLKIEKDKVEEQALELMNQIETLSTELEQLQNAVAEQQKVLAHARRQLDERTAEVADQLEQVRARRETAARAVPPEELAVFNKLAETLDGEAMCELVVDDPRTMELSCGGCFISQPPEIVNQLMSTDKMVRCSSCSRILYITDKVKDAMGIRS